MANLDPNFKAVDAPNNGSRGTTSYWQEQQKKASEIEALKARVAALEKAKP